jgi:hypothetical protein
MVARADTAKLGTSQPAADDPIEADVRRRFHCAGAGAVMFNQLPELCRDATIRLMCAHCGHDRIVRMHRHRRRLVMPRKWRVCPKCGQVY